MAPRFDWGDPETPAALFRHVTGADYQGFMFRDAAALVDQLRYLQWRLPSDFAWIGLILAGLGCAWWLRRAPALAGLALSFVVAGAVFAAGYRIPDPDAYLMTAVLGLAILCGAGLLRTQERFGARVAIALAALLVAANLTLHWRESDEHDNRLVEHFVVDLLGPLPENAVLFTAGWEVGEAASLYFQEVEGYRPDVLTVSISLVRARWYLDEIERRAPELVDRAAVPFNRYRDLLRDVELGQPHPVDVLARSRAEFLDAFASGCAQDRPVFSMTSLAEVRPEWERVPWHLAQWLRPGRGYVGEMPWLYTFEPWSNRADLYTAQAHWAYGEARFRRAQYEVRHGRTEEGRAVLAKATRFDPGFRPDQVAPLPLGYDRTVLESVRFFRGLGEAVVPTASR